MCQNIRKSIKSQKASVLHYSIDIYRLDIDLCKFVNKLIRCQINSRRKGARWTQLHFFCAKTHHPYKTSPSALQKAAHDMIVSNEILHSRGTKGGIEESCEIKKKNKLHVWRIKKMNKVTNGNNG